jgi:hypothetical protein
MLKCDICGASDAKPCVKERYIQYEEGMAGFDAPVGVGNLCEECRIEEDADLESDWVTSGPS